MVGAVPPTADVLRITSAGDAPATPHPKKERSKDAMTKPPANRQGNGHPPPRDSSGDGQATNGNGMGLGALIEEAQALRAALHDAYGRTARLVAALKRHRRQSRLVQTTLASLKQLQQLQPTDQ
jgi:hypothetical protein